MKDRAVFICGLDRSGKTYMRFMLSSHPSFAISKRTRLWTQVYRQYGNLTNNSNLDDCFTKLTLNKHIKALQLDFQKLHGEFIAGPRTYERLFAIIHQQYAQNLGKTRWGEQAELLEKNAQRVLTAFPQAKFIHMMRDPRDRFDAVIKKSQRRGGVGAATARWIYSATLAEKNLKFFPERYMVVRYESMVIQPEATMQQVCQFLEERYHPEMTTMADMSRFARNKNPHLPKNSSPLSKTYIGNFRKKLVDHEIFFIQQLSKRYMLLFGYPLIPIQISQSKSNPFYLLHWFIGAIQMISWRMWNMVA